MCRIGNVMSKASSKNNNGTLIEQLNYQWQVNHLMILTTVIRNIYLFLERNNIFRIMKTFQINEIYQRYNHMSPKKITIGLSAWITFKVVSESKYNFKLWKYDYFSTFQWRPHLIWSSNHKEIWIFVKQVTGPFVPSFAIRMYMAFTDTLRSQHTDLQTFQILCIPFQQRLILTT